MAAGVNVTRSLFLAVFLENNVKFFFPPQMAALLAKIANFFSKNFGVNIFEKH
jgi:hypothetical protein